MVRRILFMKFPEGGSLESSENAWVIVLATTLSPAA